jgi:S-adenosylmethionine:tRNA ribosyltransferase-isomerase
MDVAELDYDLPPQLIAQTPAQARDGARLLVVERSGDGLADRTFADLPGLLRPGDCLVVNDSRVIPARVMAQTVDGGAPVELLFVEPVEGGRWRSLVKPGRRCRRTSRATPSPAPRTASATRRSTRACRAPSRRPRPGCISRQR